MEIVSDYRYRGQSLSGHRPALQAEVSIAMTKGLYGDFWTSTIKPSAGSWQEIDVKIGDRAEVSDLVSVDVALERFIYPGARETIAYWQIPIVLNYVVGSSSLQAGWEFAPAQKGNSRREDNYLYLRYDRKIGAKWGFIASIGREGGISSRSKIDWLLVGSVEVKRMVITVGYVGFYEKEFGGTPTLGLSIKF